MGRTTSLIDFDTKTIYETVDARHIYWLLPYLEGHRVYVENDQNACLDWRTMLLQDTYDFKTYTKIEDLKMTENKYTVGNLSFNSWLADNMLYLRNATVSIFENIECMLNEDVEITLENGTVTYGKHKLHWYKVPNLSTLFSKYKANVETEKGIYYKDNYVWDNGDFDWVVNNLI
ncbi:hypothetical protein D3C81_06810 [compost metagenome]